MKAFIIVLVLLLAVSIAQANAQRFEAEHFSVVIPEGMKSEVAGADKISLVFQGDEDLAEGTLSISAKETEKPGPSETGWSKIRDNAIAGRSILSEGEENFAGLKWKVIAILDKNSTCEVQNVLYYAVISNISYLAHYHCTLGQCGALQKAFVDLLTSFQPKNVVITK